MAQIGGHDRQFKKDDGSKMYKEIVHYFKPAMNPGEEDEYDAVQIETYLVLTPRYLYCVDLENLEWLFDPVPFEKLGSILLSLNNKEVAIFKRF